MNEIVWWLLGGAGVLLIEWFCIRLWRINKKKYLIFFLSDINIEWRDKMGIFEKGVRKLVVDVPDDPTTDFGVEDITEGFLIKYNLLEQYNVIRTKLYNDMLDELIIVRKALLDQEYKSVRTSLYVKKWIRKINKIYDSENRKIKL
ncbi:MAG: hypothetical protein LBV58_00850 [Acholeplasmatales bacterium]|nr:hypothetical protein [Acholeplasmatales bacterium]